MLYPGHQGQWIHQQDRAFPGKAAHAGFAPEQGINALNMAELAMNNIHALRETFRDEDKVRVKHCNPRRAEAW